jgi:hypothetical protein
MNNLAPTPSGPHPVGLSELGGLLAGSAILSDTRWPLYSAFLCLAFLLRPCGHRRLPCVRLSSSCGRRGCLLDGPLGCGLSGLLLAQQWPFRLLLGNVLYDHHSSRPRRSDTTSEMV